MTSDVKPWYQSTGVLGGLAAVGFSVIGVFGWQVAPADQAAAIAHVTGIVTGLAGIVAVWGRIRATKSIG